MLPKSNDVDGARPHTSVAAGDRDRAGERAVDRENCAASLDRHDGYIRVEERVIAGDNHLDGVNADWQPTFHLQTANDGGDGDGGDETRAKTHIDDEAAVRVGARGAMQKPIAAARTNINENALARQRNKIDGSIAKARVNNLRLLLDDEHVVCAMIRGEIDDFEARSPSRPSRRLQSECERPL